MSYYDEQGRYRLEARERTLLRRLLPECDRDELTAIIDGVRRTLDRLSSAEGRPIGLDEFAHRLEDIVAGFARRWRGAPRGDDFTAGCFAELLRRYPI